MSSLLICGWRSRTASNGDHGEIVGTRGPQCAFGRLARGGSYAIDDNGFLHGASPFSLVAERLSVLQHVGHTFLRLGISAEAEERFTLEIEQILLAHQMLAGELAAAQHVG